MNLMYQILFHLARAIALGPTVRVVLEPGLSGPRGGEREVLIERACPLDKVGRGKKKPGFPEKTRFLVPDR